MDLLSNICLINMVDDKSRVFVIVFIIFRINGTVDTWYCWFMMNWNSSNICLFYHSKMPEQIILLASKALAERAKKGGYAAKIYETMR